MDLSSWVGLSTMVMAAGVAIYGVAVLLTSRALRSDQRAFRRLTDAGWYYLCFGLAIALLTSAGLLNLHDQPMLALAALIAATVLVVLAVIRWRPRQNNRR